MPPLGETSTAAAYSTLRATPGVCNPDSLKFGLMTSPYRTTLRSDAATIPTVRPTAPQMRCGRMRTPVRAGSKHEAGDSERHDERIGRLLRPGSAIAARATTTGCAGRSVAATKQTSSEVARAGGSRPRVPEKRAAENDEHECPEPGALAHPRQNYPRHGNRGGDAGHAEQLEDSLARGMPVRAQPIEIRSGTCWRSGQSPTGVISPQWLSFR